MNTPKTERYRHELNEAADRLRATPAPQDGPTGPAPGDRYVFALPVEATIEWIVVRRHPDDPGSVLLVPADDFPLVGAADVSLPGESDATPLVVRCGESLWVSVKQCPDRLRVGTVPEGSMGAVRKALAALARGTLEPSAGAECAEADPEYECWMAGVTRARLALQERAEPQARTDGLVLSVARFSAVPLVGLGAQSEVALAAAPGGELLGALSAELAAAEPRFLEVPLAPASSKLVLAADAAGVSVMWQGEPETPPPALTTQGVDRSTQVNWKPGHGAGAFHAAAVLPWVDGQVSFHIEAPVSQTFTVRL